MSILSDRRRSITGLIERVETVINSLPRRIGRILALVAQKVNRCGASSHCAEPPSMSEWPRMQVTTASVIVDARGYAYFTDKNQELYIVRASLG